MEHWGDPLCSVGWKAAFRRIKRRRNYI